MLAFVCVQVLWCSQPSGVMLSTVSLPNPSKQLTSIVHILSPETDKLATALLESVEGRE